MNLEDLIKTNPVVLLAIAVLGITLIIYRLIPSINNLVAAALTRRGWVKGQSAEAENDPTTELMNAVKALVITIQLLIETNNQRDMAAAQRDSRIGNLADMVSKSIELGTKNIENVGRLTESIAQLALTGNSQSTQLAQQTLKLSEFVGQLGAARQVSEDTRGDISKAVQAVDENKQSVEKQTQRISELKEQVEKLEKDVRDEFLPMLQGIREALNGLATKSDLAQMGEFSTKLNLIEAEVKALIVTMTTTLPPTQDVPAIPGTPDPKPNEAQPAPSLETGEVRLAPKEEKPSGHSDVS